MAFDAVNTDTRKGGDEVNNRAIEWTTNSFLGNLSRHKAELRLQVSHTACTTLSPAERRERLRTALRQALGAFPEQNCTLEPVLLERIEYEDYVLERVAYTTMNEVYVPVMVLIPKTGSGPWPAVLACHGHGNGQRDAAGLDADGQELEQPGIHNRFAVQLVKQGLLVIIPEIMGFGARRMTEDMKGRPDRTSCSTLSAHLLMHSRTLAGMRVYEAMRALDYMAEREDVDASRIGTFGFSGGSLISAFASGLDDRIKATVLCGWTNTFQGSVLAMAHCIDNYLPGILNDAEQPELIGLIAPRALFVESGELDPIFPSQHVRQAVLQLESVYKEWEVPQQFAWHIHGGGHEISGEQSIPWLCRQLAQAEC